MQCTVHWRHENDQKALSFRHGLGLGLGSVASQIVSAATAPVPLRLLLLHRSLLRLLLQLLLPLLLAVATSTQLPSTPLIFPSLVFTRFKIPVAIPLTGYFYAGFVIVTALYQLIG